MSGQASRCAAPHAQRSELEVSVNDALLGRIINRATVFHCPSRLIRALCTS